jgi:hypothetical protein
MFLRYFMKIIALFVNFQPENFSFGDQQTTDGFSEFQITLCALCVLCVNFLQNARSEEFRRDSKFGLNIFELDFQIETAKK